MEKEQIIHARWLIDGSGEEIRENILIFIRNGLIREVKKIREGDNRLPGILNFSDHTLLPGLMDAHLHLFMSGTADPLIREKQLNAGFQDMIPVISAHLEKLASCGVAAVRDGGDYAGHALRYRNECADRIKIPVHIKTAGRAWRKHGRYGKLIGRPPGKNRSLARAIAEESQRADHVKIVNSGLNSLKEFGKETPPQFEADELAAAMAKAHDMGMKVMVHCNGKLPVEGAVKAGCDSVEHGFFMGGENLRRMADMQTFWVPTAITMKAYSEQLPPGSPEAGISRRNYEHQLEQIFQAEKLGVPIALGTDAGSLGVFHGPAVMEEMKILMQAGFSLPKAVKCATSNGAGLLGIKELGRIAPGFSATFIAVKGEPETITESGREMRIFIRGQEAD